MEDRELVSGALLSITNRHKTVSSRYIVYNLGNLGKLQEQRVLGRVGRLVLVTSSHYERFQSEFIGFDHSFMTVLSEKNLY